MPLWKDGAGAYKNGITNAAHRITWSISTSPTSIHKADLTIGYFRLSSIFFDIH